MTDELRILDVAALKALAHPLRARLLDLLSQYGPSTATTLGERLGESSGSTSYHLRQLEKHGLVHELPDRGTARDRWWQRTEGRFSIGGPGTDLPSTAQQTATQLAGLSVMDSENDLVRDWMTRDQSTVPAEWRGTSGSVTYVALTPEEYEAMWQEFDAVIDRYRAVRGRVADLPEGVRRVFTQIRTVPIIDDDQPQEPTP
ncbi:ArsR/SmtB family transcription factor [Curtobacterium sp. SP.BCp]|uniref:ArsR/SmtB family transcription factor n=1 Tax=unclassified Curtobacterium TaxID=257496 RepID=UPI0025B54EE4|nr:helix-turn-helix domain-containing protein [Curtobacterium sp. 458]WJY00047.1 helix-turn-helix domain-containing protein [Curtobacterium sp. 458]